MDMKKILFALMILVSLSASAQWVAKAEESIFGGSKSTMMGQFTDSKSVILFLCDNDALSVSYIELDSKTEMDPVPVSFLVKVDGNQTIEFSTELRRKNSEVVEARGDDRKKILSILKQLKSSKQKFMVGVSVNNSSMKFSFSGDVIGSTVAVNKFTNACGIY